jgi:predicted transcriptional regulator
MSNTITIELCAEDRARLDRLAEALERKACEKCVNSALEMINTAKHPETDPIQQKLAETLAKASTPTEKPTEATEAPKAETAPIGHPADEDLPWEAATPATKADPTVTQEQLQQKVMQLAAANNGTLKAKVREIVNAYAKKVSDVPEDKRAEVWTKLTALEKEV